MSTRFDPAPGEPYGHCRNCEAQLQQESDAREHMSQTMQGRGPSHRIHVTNPTRPQRIRSSLGLIIDDALRQAADEIQEMVDGGDLSLEEARSVLAMRGIDEDYLE